VDLRQVNKRVLENLVLAGAFDSLGLKRKEALAVLDDCLRLAAEIKEVKNSNQLSLFGGETFTLEEPVPPRRGEFSTREKLKKEKEVLGFYVSENPLEEYRETLPYLTTHDISELEGLEDGMLVRIAGMVTGLKRSRNKKGDPWARVTLEDFTGKADLLVFPSVYRRQGGSFKADTAVLVEGRVIKQDELPSIAVNQVYQIPGQVGELHIRLPESVASNGPRKDLVNTLSRYSGELPVYLRLPVNRVIRLDRNLWVEASLFLKKELATMYGKENIWFN